MPSKPKRKYLVVTIALQKYSKTSRETKSVAMDCGGMLGAGELIQSITSIEQSSSDDEADELTITGQQVNTDTIAEPGRRAIAPGEGIQFFVAGGTAGVLYHLTARVLTTRGQDLDATGRLSVTADEP